MQVIEAGSPAYVWLAEALADPSTRKVSFDVREWRAGTNIAFKRNGEHVDARSQHCGQAVNVLCPSCGRTVQPSPAHNCSPRNAK